VGQNCLLNITWSGGLNSVKIWLDSERSEKESRQARPLPWKISSAHTKSHEWGGGSHHHPGHYSDSATQTQSECPFSHERRAEIVRGLEVVLYRKLLDEQCSQHTTRWKEVVSIYTPPPSSMPPNLPNQQPDPPATQILTIPS